MLTFLKADLRNDRHTSDLLHLLNSYALDPMGGGEALSPYCRQHLISELQQRERTVHAFLLYQDHVAAAFSICIEGFSTFACKPLLNIHDFAVHPDFRGRQLGKHLMSQISQYAEQHGFCKLTLEVLEGNHPAQALYRSQGFAGYELNPAMGGAIVMQKKF
ncbi:GNAT family N-acetyltransferase [Undibacterium griseum]|uniref:GNAT family N-acetyltransferase n=1 Tax=Undibacterium griseum TaxID=2762295 RepID=A0ABR6YN94_9BURK|nr:GNAT family N-acetyltransferase [Undibacterium griseum]MBC3885365.1 GNAT family N-acetyltransferase [Undibacterium griseum]